MVDSWSSVMDDEHLVVSPELPFYVEDKDVAIEFRELLDENGLYRDFTDFAALITVHHRDFVEDLASEYDREDVEDAREICEEMQATPKGRDVISELKEEYADVEGEQLEDAKKAFKEALRDSATGADTSNSE